MLGKYDYRRTQYDKVIAFPRQQWLRERASILRLCVHFMSCLMYCTVVLRLQFANHRVMERIANGLGANPICMILRLFSPRHNPTPSLSISDSPKFPSAVIYIHHILSFNLIIF
jgi:hypothetical protein